MAGNRRAVLLGSELGIGKTTLTAMFAAAAERDAWVLYGRCDEDLFVPCQPWIEALGHLVAYAPNDLLTEHVNARGGRGATRRRARGPPVGRRKGATEPDDAPTSLRCEVEHPCAVASHDRDFARFDAVT